MPFLEDTTPFAGGVTWFRVANYVPPAGSGGPLAGLARRYSPVAEGKLPILVRVSGAARIIKLEMTGSWRLAMQPRGRL